MHIQTNYNHTTNTYDKIILLVLALTYAIPANHVCHKDDGLKLKEI